MDHGTSVQAMENHTENISLKMAKLDNNQGLDRLKEVRLITFYFFYENKNN